MKKRSRRRRNPAIMGSIENVAGITFGVFLTENVPTFFGSAGIVAQLAAGAGATLLARALSKRLGESVMMGSLAALASGIAKAYFMPTLAPAAPGMGFYVDNSFPLPTIGSGPYLLNPGFEGSAPQMNGGM